MVAGFPANDFKAQEPGTNDEIQSFCTLNYGVKFPMFGKIHVTGAEKHPLYASLIAAQPTAKGDPAGWAAVLKQHDIEPTPRPRFSGTSRSSLSVATAKW